MDVSKESREGLDEMHMTAPGPPAVFSVSDACTVTPLHPYKQITLAPYHQQSALPSPPKNRPSL